MLIIDKSYVDLCSGTLAEFTGTNLDFSEVIDIITTDYEFLQNLVENYEVGVTSNMETSDRVWLLDVFARRIGFDHWPVKTDSKAYANTFLQALVMLGYKNVL